MAPGKTIIDAGDKLQCVLEGMKFTPLVLVCILFFNLLLALSHSYPLQPLATLCANGDTNNVGQLA